MQVIKKYLSDKLFWFLTLSFLMSVFLFSNPFGAFAEEARPNLSGMWRLNEEKSENPEEVIKQAMKEMKKMRGGGGEGMQGPRGGRRGRGEMGAGRGTGGYRGGQGIEMGGMNKEMMNELRESMKLLLITHEEPVFDIMDGQERTRVFYTDGRENEQSSEFGENRIKAHWKGETLVVESISNQNPTIIKKYDISKEGNQLNVTVQVDLERINKTIQIKYVYDLIP